jgi:hypothetical protein
MRKTDVRRDGKIKKAAFLPSSSGKDRDGLSVSILDPEYVDLHRAKFERPDKSTAKIIVADVRATGLDVVASPDKGDPGHALITGIPDRTVGDDQMKEAERLAQLLADRASEYKFPLQVPQ